MRNLRRRLEKLETSIEQRKTYGRWFMEQEALIEQTAMSKMPADDLPVLEELLASEHAPSSRDLSDQQRIVWRRWQEAFTRTGDEIPFGLTMATSDPWC